MPRGRPPKPTALKALEGGRAHVSNAQKAVIEKGGTVQPRPLMEPPPQIKGAAAEEWRRVLAAMPPGFYTEADRGNLVIHCLAWVTYLDAVRAVARKGTTSVGSQGQPVVNPDLLVMQKQAELLIRISDRLGMSPVARARLDVAPAAPPEQPQDRRAGLWGSGGVA